LVDNNLVFLPAEAGETGEEGDASLLILPGWRVSNAIDTISNNTFPGYYNNFWMNIYFSV